MGILDKYRDEIERIAMESESTLSQPDLIEQREQLLKIFGDIFGVEWIEGERVERNEVNLDENDENILQYEPEVDEIGSQVAADLSLPELRRQRRRLIEIFREIDEDQEYEEETVIDEDRAVDDEETVV